MIKGIYMTKLNFRVLYKVFLSCSLSLAMVSSPSYAMHNDDRCSNTDFGKGALILGGSFLIGGIIGLVAGHASNDHRDGHSGSRGRPGFPGLQGSAGPQGISGEPGIPGVVGPSGTNIAGEAGTTGATGATGPAGNFILDPNAILTFEYGTDNAINVTNTSPSQTSLTITAIPYVTTPDNRVIVGAPLTVTQDVGEGIFFFDFDFTGNNVVVNEVYIGQYQPGILFINESDATITVGPTSFEAPIVEIDLNGDSTIDDTILLTPFTPPTSDFDLGPREEFEVSIGYEFAPTLYG